MRLPIASTDCTVCHALTAGTGCETCTRQPAGNPAVLATMELIRPAGCAPTAFCVVVCCNVATAPAANPVTDATIEADPSAGCATLKLVSVLLSGAATRTEYIFSPPFSKNARAEYAR